MRRRRSLLNAVIACMALGLLAPFAAAGQRESLVASGEASLSLGEEGQAWSPVALPSTQDSDGVRETDQYTSNLLPLTLLLELEDGTVVHLDVLYLFGIIANGPAELVSAQVTTAAGKVRAPDDAHRWFANPEHHLLDPQYRLTFEVPLGDACGIYVRGGTLYGLGPPDEFQVCWLDANHDCFRTVLAVKETWTAPEYAYLGTGLRLH